MAQQGASPGMAANPAAPGVPDGSGLTGSPWEASLMGRLGPSVNPEDIALRQRMFENASAATRAPRWQVPGMGTKVGQQIQDVSTAMGPTIPGGRNAGAGPRLAGYYASKPGPMGQTFRNSGLKMAPLMQMGRR